MPALIKLKIVVHKIPLIDVEMNPDPPPLHVGSANKNDCLQRCFSSAVGLKVMFVNIISIEIIYIISCEVGEGGGGGGGGG